MLSSMANATTLEVRNLRFDVESDVPRHWHAAGRSITTFFDALSTFFPEGERFFVASVHAHRAHVTARRMRRGSRPRTRARSCSTSCSSTSAG